jgi:nucleoside-diphosphate-sugar epimerase
MRVLVIGGTRLSGPDVVRQLLEHGHLPAVLHRGEHEAELPAAVAHYHGAATDPELLRHAAREFKPDALVHMWCHNPAHVELVTEAFPWLQKVVVISSGDVYATFELIEQQLPSPYPSPLSESAPLRSGPYRAYEGMDYDKTGAERAALAGFEAGRLPAVIVRYPAVYGPGPVREWYWVKRIRDRRLQIALPDGGLNVFHRGFTLNLAYAVVLTLEKAKPGSVYNAGDEAQYNVSQLTDMIARALDHQWTVVHVPAEAWEFGTPYSLGRNHLIYDLSAIKRDLGYRDLVSPEEALRVTVEHLSMTKPGHVMQIHPQAFDYAAEDAAIARYRPG